MKYSILLFCLLLTTNLIGQDFKEVDCQANFGTSISMPYKSYVALWPGFDGGPQAWYYAGVGCFLDFLFFYRITGNYGLTSGLSFNMINLKILNKEGFFELKGNRYISYINLPVSFDYKLTKKLTASAGAYGGFLLSAKEKGRLYVNSDQMLIKDENDPVFQSLKSGQDHNSSIRKYYKLYDFGLLAKLAYETKLNSNISGVITAQFNYGLSNISTSEEVFGYKAQAWKNINLQLGLGLKF